MDQNLCSHGPAVQPRGEGSKTACRLLIFHPRAFELQPIKSCSISSSSINSFRTWIWKTDAIDRARIWIFWIQIFHVFLGFYCFRKQEFNATQSKQAVAQSCCSLSPQAYSNTNIGCSHLVFQHKQIAVTVIARQNLLPSSIFGIHLNAGAIYESDSSREKTL